MVNPDRVQVALDVFPATVSVASTTYNNVRAVIADGVLQVYCLTGSGVNQVYVRPVLAVDGSVHQGVNVTTDDGAVWIEQAGGCGCGSQLKIADLFDGRQRVMVPLHA